MEKISTTIKMEAATLCFAAAAPLSQLKSTRTINSLVPMRFLHRPHRTVLIYRRTLVSSAADPAPETSSVDYSSSTSVFPAEACETVGGEACDGEIYPEVKPTSSPANSSRSAGATEDVDREYVEYDEPKTVFPGEACDDLGGEFCGPEYQKGVHK